MIEKDNRLTRIVPLVRVCQWQRSKTSLNFVNSITIYIAPVDADGKCPLTQEHMFYIIHPMIRPWEGLLVRMGFQRTAGWRSFALDASLHSALVELAAREQRPAKQVQADLLAAALVQHQMDEELVQRWQELSRREQEVAAFTCMGYTNRQIAAKLAVSPNTVKGYVRQVLVKFHLHSKDELHMRLGAWDFSRWGEPA
jgi:DNA-binding CsgD family transcriptional regulator